MNSDQSLFSNEDLTDTLDELDERCLPQSTAETDQIALFNPLDLHRSSPEFGDLQCRTGVSKVAICLHYGVW